MQGHSFLDLAHVWILKHPLVRQVLGGLGAFDQGVGLLWAFDLFGDPRALALLQLVLFALRREPDGGTSRVDCNGAVVYVETEVHFLFKHFTIMKPISKCAAITAIVLSIFGLLFFPIISIAESRGNLVLTRKYPEETKDRIQALWISWCVMLILLVNSSIYLYIGSRREAQQAKRDAEEEERKYDLQD